MDRSNIFLPWQPVNTRKRYVTWSLFKHKNTRLTAVERNEKYALIKFKDNFTFGHFTFSNFYKFVKTNHIFIFEHIIKWHARQNFIVNTSSFLTSIFSHLTLIVVKSFQKSFKIISTFHIPNAIILKEF